MKNLLKLICIFFCLISSQATAFDWQSEFRTEQESVSNYTMAPMFISLGYNCSIASRISGRDLRTVSLPFDWMVTPTRTLIELFENDFDDFLNPTNLVYNGDYVFDEKYKIMFFGSDFPQKIWNWKRPGRLLPLLHKKEHLRNAFQEIVEKYQRRVARLYAILQSNLDLYLVRMSIESHIAHQLKVPHSIFTRQDAVDLNNVLKRKFPGSHIDITCVQVRSDGLVEEWGENMRFFSVGKNTPELNVSGSIDHPDFCQLFKFLQEKSQNRN